MATYKYLVLKKVKENIDEFYLNVAKKYSNTYSYKLMCKNIDDAIDSMYQIENGLLRRNPTISRWKDYYMANTDKWYFAYKINGETIYIMDACHSQNMHENKEDLTVKPILELMQRMHLLR